MSAPIRRRLEALECLEWADAQRPILVITRYDGEAIGINDVLRLPGESFDDLVARAAARVPGATPVLLLATYADDGAGSCVH